MLKKEEVLSRLPYGKSFLFVDQLLEISEEHVVGGYTFSPEAYFYKSHFLHNPVTPGVILTECMAQIGLVCLGIYLTSDQTIHKDMTIAMTENHIIYNKPVYPGEYVHVKAKKLYFRMHKLKCSVVMKNSKNEEVCKGEIAGVMIHKDAK